MANHRIRPTRIIIGSRWLSVVFTAVLVAAGLVIAVSPPVQAAVAACPNDARDLRAALDAAASCQGRVEVASARTEQTQVFANANGTQTLESSVVPSRVRRPDGSWADIDTTLRAGAGGSLAPIATLADVSFSPGGTGPFVTLRQGMQTLTLTWPTALPAPSVSGSAATYVGVLPDVDLIVMATATGFSHVLAVKTAAAAANSSLRSIRYAVGGTATIKSSVDGRLRFADSTGRTIAMAADAAMWDSSIVPELAGQRLTGMEDAIAAMRGNPPAELVSTPQRPGAAARTAHVALSTTGGADLVLTPDAAMLSATSTTFPLFIDPAISPGHSKWAYANSINSNWAVGGEAWIGANPYDGTLYRSFFDFPTTSGSLTIKGKQIISAAFKIELNHSWSCSPTAAHIYRTGAITVASGGRMSWSTRPLGSGAVWLASDSANANEAGGCGVIQPDVLMEFSSTTFKNDVQYAANQNWNTYTVGICTCNSSGQYESTQDRWKRFYVDNRVKFVVSFNTIPGIPANLAPHPGVACAGTVATTSPSLQAQYVDADTADTLGAVFEWKQLPSGTPTQVTGPNKPANNFGSVTLTLGSSAEGKTYSFRVQTHDATHTSSWSGWCDFTVNTSVPTAPIVTSGTHVACDPATIGTCTASGGPGVSAGFTFSEPVGDPNGQDVVSYTYGWTDPPTNLVTVAAGASYGPVQLTPPRFGINRLYVFSKDVGGLASPTTTFTFLVNGPSGPTALWPLDTISAHNFNDQVGSAHLTPTSVTWTPDARYIGTASESTSAATFASTSQATATVSGFNTATTFSASAWVKLSSTTCSGNQSAVAIDGAHVSGFLLSYDCAAVRWRMRIPALDQAVPSFAEAVSANNSAVAGRWTLVTGVYDGNEHKIRLYLNNVLAQEVTPTSTWLTSRGAGWSATGPVTVGRDRWNDTNGGHFVGEIADVRVWNRVVTIDDVLGTSLDAANGVPAVAGLTAPLRVGSWDFQLGPDCYCNNAMDISYWARSLYLDNGWLNSPPTSQFAVDAHDGYGSVELDGAAGYASTTDPDNPSDVPVVRTDQSLSVSVWVRPSAFSTSQQSVIRQGAGGSALKLYLDNADNKWVFTISTPNGSGGYTWATARSNAAAALDGNWVHLVGVFDVSTGQVRLYVNGAQQTIIGTGGVGWYSSASRFYVGTTGGANYFAGSIDQVQVYAGALSAREVSDLYLES